MPNGKTHLLTGTVCGALTSIIIQNNLKKRDNVDLVHIILSSGVGFAGGRLPDIFEPPTNPNHRTFFHSFIFGAILGYLAIFIWNQLKESKSVESKSEQKDLIGIEIILDLLFVVIMAILLHLFLDSMTQKGLPII
ncbi:MAG: metal-dependent hydrolase [Bacteroidota bacterium]